MNDVSFQYCQAQTWKTICILMPCMLDELVISRKEKLGGDHYRDVKVQGVHV